MVMRQANEHKKRYVREKQPDGLQSSCLEEESREINNPGIIERN